ncbi:YeeE/YedE family protein [uncultured Piscinibacter sp.]|uniref:YeeE/YedE family protein n=1 Tax=uncultured Piscinibacter sp. TaxID=1131835 RepID=UPI00262C77A3|nr:YeeE/YedE family protein [uncultured Piscinibacter sp.]
MELSQVQALQTQVLWAAFGVSLAFGAIAQRTHFCTMGAISDIFNMGNWVRMRMWGMAVGVAMIGFYAMAALGWINASASIYSSARVPWLSALVGGALFGFGMVLASGCGSKTLVRIGDGNLKSVVVFFVMGFGAYASMRGMTGLLSSRTIDRVSFEMPGGSGVPTWLSGLLGIDPVVTGLALSLLVGGGLVAWALADAEFRTSADHLLAGLGIGGVIVAMWWIIGHMGFVPEHPETLEPVYLGTAGGRMQALSFTSPMARTLDYVMSFDANTVLSLGVVSVVGVVLGSFAYALTSRRFQWEGFNGAQDTGLHLVGGLCMGVGGVTAGGCTVGQGLSGLSTLGLTSFIAVTGIMLGAVLGLHLQRWLIMRE